MRLSKDSDSWKAGGILRRDFRHTHDGPEEMPHRSKPKNGKKWCRGKEGRKHQPYRVQGKFYDYDACKVCGKKLAWYWRFL